MLPVVAIPYTDETELMNIGINECVSERINERISKKCRYILLQGTSISASYLYLLW